MFDFLSRQFNVQMNMSEQYLKQVQHNLLKVSVHVQYIIQSSLTQNYRYSSAFSACIVQS